MDARVGMGGYGWVVRFMGKGVGGWVGGWRDDEKVAGGERCRGTVSET